MKPQSSQGAAVKHKENILPHSQYSSRKNTLCISQLADCAPLQHLKQATLPQSMFRQCLTFNF